MLTTRDISIIEFVTIYKVASTSTISHFFFSSISACHKRLKILSDNGSIKRARDSINNEYVYFKKLPKQLKHSLLVTEFYREASGRYEIVNFKIEPVIGNIRPDAVFGYIKNGKKYLGLLEVEISHKGFDYLKYEKFKTSENYKQYFPTMPTIFIIGDNIKQNLIKDITFKIISENMNNVVL